MQGLPGSDVSGSCLLSRYTLKSQDVSRCNPTWSLCPFTLISVLSGLLPVNEVQMHSYPECDDSFDLRPMPTLILLQ